MHHPVTPSLIVQALRNRGLDPRHERPAQGGSWILWTHGTVTQAKGDSHWYWSTIRSDATRPGDGRFNTLAGMRTFLACLPATRRHASG